MRAVLQVLITHGRQLNPAKISFERKPLSKNKIQKGQKSSGSIKKIRLIFKNKKQAKAMECEMNIGKNYQAVTKPENTLAETI